MTGVHRVWCRTCRVWPWSRGVHTRQLRYDALRHLEGERLNNRIYSVENTYVEEGHTIRRYTSLGCEMFVLYFASRAEICLRHVVCKATDPT